MKSQPLSISRYSNGTLVKLSVSDSAFVSYDFDPEKNTGTYTPTSITITPTFSGGVKFGSWRYSTDGATFQNVVSGQHGFTINGGAVILAATSDLYATTNSAVIVACVGDDPTYFDTVTIMRYVDPTFVFRQTSTAIKQTNDKISLIATEEQLERYGQNFTVLDDLQAQVDVIPSQISLAVSQEHTIITGEMDSALAKYATLETMESRLTITAKDITSSVAKTYQTKADAIEDLDEAKGYTDDVKATLRSEIQQSANSITSTVSATYQTIADAEDDLDEAKSYANNKATQLESKITQTAKDITSSVAKTYQTKADAIEDLDEAKGYTDDVKATLRSEIQQSANSITSTVSATYQTIADAEDDLDEAKSYANNKATQLESKITQTAKSITSTVSQNYQNKTDAASDLKNAKTYADNKDAALKTEIKQTTDSISSTVSNKVGKNEIISSINQSAESVKISASKVDITGFVTFSDLSTSGKSTINGSNITTGSISASLIKGGKLILRPGSTYTTAIEVQNSSGTKLIAIDGNGMTGYSGGAAPTFKLLGNEISFYRSSTVLTQIKDGDIYTAGKLYFTSGNSWAGTHIIEIGQTLSGAVLNVISGKTTLKATEIFASSGKALLITGNSSNYALHVTLGETVLQKLTAGATSVSSLSASGTATIAGATTINNTLTVSAGSNGSDAIKVSTGRINAPVYYGALYATSSNLGFFGGSTNATKQSVSKLSLYATLRNVITKVNDLLTALAKYNLITSY